MLYCYLSKWVLLVVDYVDGFQLICVQSCKCISCMYRRWRYGVQEDGLQFDLTACIYPGVPKRNCLLNLTVILLFIYSSHFRQRCLNKFHLIKKHTFSGNISIAVPSSCNQLVTRTYSRTSGGISHLWCDPKHHWVLLDGMGSYITWKKGKKE